MQELEGEDHGSLSSLSYSVSEDGFFKSDECIRRHVFGVFAIGPKGFWGFSRFE